MDAAFEELCAVDKAVLAGRKLTTIDLVGGILCHICNLTFQSKQVYEIHYKTHSTENNKEIIYTCVKCSLKCNHYRSFRGHCYNSHVVRDRYKCQYCSTTFSKKTNLDVHVKAMHNVKCSQCDEQFPSKKELNLHSAVHKNANTKKPPYPCLDCGRNITTLNQCDDHIDDHCIFHTYTCPICDHAITKENAPKHMTTHFDNDDNTISLIDEELENVKTSEYSFMNIVGGMLCCYCDELFQKHEDFDQHCQERHPDEPIIFTCNICHKQFKKYNIFSSHCYDHCNKDKYVCELCDKTFNRLSLLVEHASAHVHCEDDEEARFTCALCPKSFHSARRTCEHAVTVHGLTAGDDALLLCPYTGCNAKLQSPRDLVTHVATSHTGSSQPAACRTCSLRLPTLTAAVRHVRDHRAPSYGCPVCKRRYSKRTDLAKHLDVHFESVYFVCITCGKVFESKCRLAEHAKVHAERKAYACEVCGKAFAKTNHLQQHLNVHTSVRPFACIKCPRTFAQKPNWFKHMTRIHNISEKERRKLARAAAAGARPSQQMTLPSPSVSSPSMPPPPPPPVPPSPPVSSLFPPASPLLPLSPYPSETLDLIALEQCVDLTPLSALSAAEVAELLPEPNEQFVSDVMCSGALNFGGDSIREVAPDSIREVAPDSIREVAPDSIREVAPDEFDEDDYAMPPIDPDILSRLHTPPHHQHREDIEMGWEPVITKVYTLKYAEDPAERYSIMNTDVY